MPQQPCKSSNTSMCGCRGPTLHMQILTLVQIPNNSNNGLHQGRLPTINTQILRLVQVPEAAQANPYACTGSQQLRPFLTPGPPLDNSKNSLHN
ncbi:hypothetical protein O181_058619 [Austropuccinia psidii MF-1]|uniref:Uncharacterized protein n=1 Tax=Austropuccinia psidii MF-1 TaxID=1389203 RepID=A0A9Q3HXU1_9BASI|nr:hypothetical protein [Austropuccinia psidii MF-1]